MGQCGCVIRPRIIKQQGYANNHIIWFVQCSDFDLVRLEHDCAYDPTGSALDIIDEWLLNKKSHHNSYRRSRGLFFCDGHLLYAGNNAWDGILNNKSAGICITAFPIHSTPRRVAGDPISGDILKCASKSVNDAREDRTDGNMRFSDAQREQLKLIFPTGICDYRKHYMAITHKKKKI